MSSLLETHHRKRQDRVSFKGRILFLTEDPELIKRQLAVKTFLGTQKIRQQS